MRQRNVVLIVVLLLYSTLGAGQADYIIDEPDPTGLKFDWTRWDASQADDYLDRAPFSRELLNQAGAIIVRRQVSRDKVVNSAMPVRIGARFEAPLGTCDNVEDCDEAVADACEEAGHGRETANSDITPGGECAGNCVDPMGGLEAVAIISCGSGGGEDDGGGEEDRDPPDEVVL